MTEETFDLQTKLIEHFHKLWREAADSNVAFQRALGKAGAFLSKEEYVEVIEVFNETLARIKSWSA